MTIRRKSSSNSSTQPNNYNRKTGMKTLIRNASVYRAEIRQTEAELAQALSEEAFVKPLPSQASSRGFTPFDSGEFLQTFHGGYAFTVRIDEKVIPSSALKAETERLRSVIVDETGRTPGRKEMREVKDEARLNLMIKALERTTLVRCFYHVEQKLLIVASTSQKVCDTVTSLLVHTLETLKTQTIHVSVRGGLSARLKQWVDEEGDSQAFGDLIPNGQAAMVSLDKRTLSVKSSDLLTNLEALKEAFKRFYEVKSMSLASDDLSFVLTEKFKFGSIVHNYPGDDSDGEPLAWSACASIEVAGLVQAVNALCGMFGYGEELQK